MDSKIKKLTVTKIKFCLTNNDVDFKSGLKKSDYVNILTDYIVVSGLDEKWLDSQFLEFKSNSTKKKTYMSDESQLFSIDPVILKNTDESRENEEKYLEKQKEIYVKRQEDIINNAETIEDLRTSIVAKLIRFPEFKGNVFTTKLRNEITKVRALSLYELKSYNDALDKYVMTEFDNGQTKMLLSNAGSFFDTILGIKGCSKDFEDSTEMNRALGLMMINVQPSSPFTRLIYNGVIFVAKNFATPQLPSQTEVVDKQQK